MAAHAKIGPSALSRARLCPGSVSAVEPLPRSTTEYAAEGTLLHEIAADCLEHGFEPEDYIGRKMRADGYTFELGYESGQTDPSCMVDVIDWLREQPGEMFIETRVNLDPYMPGQFGRLDVAWLHGSTANLLDFKFGRGEPVVTEGNEQGLGYGIGLYETILKPRGIRPKRFRLMIEQPRLPGGARYYQPWEISFDELMAFGDVMRQIWASANDPDAPRVAGRKQCHFCQAKDTCDAYARFMWDLASEAANTDGSILTPERRTWLLKHADMISGWFERLHVQAMAECLAAGEVAGLKAVDGPAGKREYTDEAAAAAVLRARLGDKGFVTKPKSPAQIEALTGGKKKKPDDPETWKAIQPFIKRPESKPQLVLASDPRPAKLNDYSDKFDETED